MAVAPSIAAERRPAAARALIAAVSALGLAVLAVRGAGLLQGPGSALAATAAIAVAVAAADQFTLALPHGGEEEQFALTDSVWIAAIVLAPAGTPTVGAALGALAWQLAQRYEPHKIAFNVGQVALALTAAELVWSLAGARPAPDEPAAWALAAAACAVAFVVNETTVALVIARVRATPLRDVIAPACASASCSGRATSRSGCSARSSGTPRPSASCSWRCRSASCTSPTASGSPGSSNASRWRTWRARPIASRARATPPRACR